MLSCAGSDPLAVQPYYEKIFDSITMVEHDRKDKTIIREMVNRDSGADERIPFKKPVKAINNIEDWLMDLLNEQQRTMKSLCRVRAAGFFNVCPPCQAQLSMRRWL